ncbi:MAG TPA: thioesterase family protein [Burkholderiales bacterium]|nr:thioesterase family protein [Burkholderiales bacterium]
MNLYLRLIFLALRMIGLPRRGVLDDSCVRFRVLPNDCDVNLHMNNGRYLSFMDLGRVHLIVQLGLLSTIFRNRWRPVLAAAEINFIRQLAPFQPFDLVTRVVTWDEKYVYMEQRFESRGELCAHAFVKGLFLGPEGRVSNAGVVALLGHDAPAPQMPEELRLWTELGSAKKQRADEQS